MSADRNESILAIDFGTSYSAARLLQPGEEPWEVVEPSAVLAHRGGLLVGSQAEEQKLHAPPRTYCKEFKLDLGSTAPIRLGGTPYEPQDLLRAMLAALADAARNQLTVPGGTLGRTVLTVPASYERHPRLRELMLSAAEDAGLGPGPVQLLPEPVAAAWSVRSQLTTPHGQLVLVYDFGGGTFDAALIDLRPDVGWRKQVLGTASVNRGGNDIDADLAGLLRGKTAGRLADRLRETAERDVVEYRFEVASRDAAERLKRDFSETTSTSVAVKIFDMGTVVTEDELAELARPHISETITCCRQLLAKAGKKVADLDAILPVGGSAKMPLVQRMLREELGRDLSQGGELWLDTGPRFDPDLAVVRGASAWAAANEIPSLTPMDYRSGGSLLRWDTGRPDHPGDAEPRLMRWLIDADPGRHEEYDANTALARIRYADGTLWDLTACERGRFGMALADPPETPHGVENGVPIMPRQWIATTDTERW